MTVDLVEVHIDSHMSTCIYKCAVRASDLKEQCTICRADNCPKSSCTSSPSVLNWRPIHTGQLTHCTHNMYIQSNTDTWQLYYNHLQLYSLSPVLFLLAHTSMHWRLHRCSGPSLAMFWAMYVAMHVQF